MTTLFLSKVFASLAAPMLLSSLALAYRRKVTRMQLMPPFGVQRVVTREALSPAASRVLLIASFVLASASLVLRFMV